MEISALCHNTRPEGPLLPQEEAAFSLLEELGIAYDRVSSEPADTMEKCAAVSEVLAQRCPVPAGYVAVEDEFGEVGPQGYLQERFGLTAAHIVEQAKAVLARK